MFFSIILQLLICFAYVINILVSYMIPLFSHALHILHQSFPCSIGLYITTPSPFSSLSYHFLLTFRSFCSSRMVFLLREGENHIPLSGILKFVIPFAWNATPSPQLIFPQLCLSHHSGFSLTATVICRSFFIFLWYFCKLRHPPSSSKHSCHAFLNFRVITTH